jgi:Fe-S cluster assembly protein SufD
MSDIRSADSLETVPFVRAALEQARRAPGGAGWLDLLRAEGLAAFEAAGLPGRRDEAWRYTAAAIGGLRTTAFAPAPAVSLDSVPPGKALEVPGHRVVLVNGRLVPALSDAGAPEGVTIASLDSVLRDDPAGLEGRLGRLMPLDGHPFAALNTAVLSDGLVIRVRPGAVVGTPLHIVSIAAAGEAPAAFHPRLFVEVGEGAVAALVESHVGLGGPATLSNGVSEIVLGDGASLTHAVLQNEARGAVHIAAVQAVLGAEAFYDGFRLSFGGALSRADLRVAFTGEGAEARLNGAYAAGGGQHMDTTGVFDHAVPRCRSENVYKGVLDGTGRGVFQGRIDVARAAQKTDGRQLHKALLLSREAEIDTKPELRIYADDVQCAHGAAAGALDQDALFYLQARGIAPDEARALLIEGFLDDVIDGVASDPLREAMLTHVHAWLESRRASLLGEAA